MSALTGFSALGRSLILAAAIAVVVTFIKFAASVIAPILLAVFITIVATPPLRWMRVRGVPKWIALLVIVFVLLDIGSVFALATTGALEVFKDSWPSYQERFLLLSDQLGNWLEGAGVAGSRAALPDIFEPGNVLGLVRVAISNVSSTCATGLLILLAVVFMLLEAPTLLAKLKKAYRLTEDAEQRLQRLLSSVNHYMLIKTLTSLATALSVWVWLWLLGIDFAVLWTLLAFVLNFVPFVGAVLMTIPPVMLALVQVDPQTSFLVAIGFILINAIIGSIVEPRIMGRGLGISTLAVFLSLIFWGWILGTIGVFLSVPLTIALMIALDANQAARPMAILLGPEQAKEAAPEVGERTREGSAD
jgi:AI-2 transport protein TqsA